MGGVVWGPRVMPFWRLCRVSRGRDVGTATNCSLHRIVKPIGDHKVYFKKFTPPSFVSCLFSAFKSPIQTLFARNAVKR